MKKHEFSIIIDASKEKVWEALWQDVNYREWTSVFGEGSKAESDWQKGSRILFIDAKGDGMVSQIADNIPNQYMSFKHLGMIMNGVEDMVSEKVKEWSGAMENYTLADSDGITSLTVDIDIAESHEKYFLDTFPQALKKVKEIAERN